VNLNIDLGEFIVLGFIQRHPIVMPGVNVQALVVLGKKLEVVEIDSILSTADEFRHLH
jgi:hypothetical protein